MLHWAAAVAAGIVAVVAVREGTAVVADIAVVVGTVLAEPWGLGPGFGLDA